MSLGMKKDQDYAAIGIDVAGKRAIEGLLPDAIRTTVFGKYPDLVMAATSGTKEEKDQAHRQLKRKYLEEFKASAKPGAIYFSEFYKVVQVLNKALKSA